MRRSRGYTLIELMFVLVILTIVATIAFVGLGKDNFDMALRRYTDDVAGAVVSARNLAIDSETLVTVEVQRERVITSWIDPTTKVSQVLFNVSMNDNYGGILLGKACMYGVYAGVKAPSAPLPPSSTFPTQCMSTGTGEQLVFQPDGTVIWNNLWLDNAGLTIVLADERLGAANAAYKNLVQIYPGGLVQVIEKVEN